MFAQSEATRGGRGGRGRRGRVETLAGRVGRGYLARKAPRTVICARQERGQLARARGREGSAPIRWVHVRRTEGGGRGSAHSPSATGVVPTPRRRAPRPPRLGGEERDELVERGRAVSLVTIRYKPLLENPRPRPRAPLSAGSQRPESWHPVPTTCTVHWCISLSIGPASPVISFRSDSPD